MNELDPERDEAASGLLLRDDPDLDLRPGGSAVVEVAIRTESPKAERVDLAVGGPLAPWATIEPSHLTVRPGADHSATIRFDLPVAAGLPAGPTGFTVEVSPRARGTSPEGGNGGDKPQGWVTEGMAFVLPMEAHRLELVPGRRRARVEVINDGNVSLVLHLDATATSGNLNVSLEDESLVMAPGATAATWLKLDGAGSYRVEARSSDGVVATAIGSSDQSVSRMRSSGPRASRARHQGAPGVGPAKASTGTPSAPTPKAPPGGKAGGKATTSPARASAVAFALVVLCIADLVGVVIVDRAQDPPSARLVAGGPSNGPHAGDRVSGTTAPLAQVATAPPPTASAAGDPLVKLTDAKGQPLPAPVPLPGTPPAGKVAPVHRLFDVAHGDYVYAATASDLAAAKKKGFVDQGVLGQIEVDKQDGTVALREFVNKDGRHRLTRGDPEHASALADGYTEVLVVGWMFMAPVGAGLALYRATLGAASSLTTSPVEQQGEVAAGWADGGIIAYLVA